MVREAVSATFVLGARRKRFRVRIQEGLAGVRPFENPVEDKRHLYRIETSVKVKRHLYRIEASVKVKRYLS